MRGSTGIDIAQLLEPAFVTTVRKGPFPSSRLDKTQPSWLAKGATDTKGAWPTVLGAVVGYPASQNKV